MNQRPLEIIIMAAGRPRRRKRRRRPLVQIQSLGPRRSKLYIACSDFFLEVNASTCRCKLFSVSPCCGTSIWSKANIKLRRTFVFRSFSVLCGALLGAVRALAEAFFPIKSVNGKKDGIGRPFCQQTEHGIVRDGRLRIGASKGCGRAAPAAPAFLRENQS